jgi:hypothetical protein
LLLPLCKLLRGQRPGLLGGVFRYRLAPLVEIAEVLEGGQLVGRLRIGLLLPELLGIRQGGIAFAFGLSPCPGQFVDTLLSIPALEPALLVTLFLGLTLFRFGWCSGGFLLLGYFLGSFGFNRRSRTCAVNGVCFITHCASIL